MDKFKPHRWDPAYRSLPAEAHGPAKEQRLQIDRNMGSEIKDEYLTIYSPAGPEGSIPSGQNQDADWRNHDGEVKIPDEGAK